MGNTAHFPLVRKISKRGSSLNQPSGTSQARRCIQTEKDIEILNSLACGSFDEVVNGTHHDDPVEPGVQKYPDIAKIRAGHRPDTHQILVRS
jgi:hypothetical protein